MIRKRMSITASAANEYYCIRCQYVGNEEDVLKRNEVVRMKYGAMMKRFTVDDF